MSYPYQRHNESDTEYRARWYRIVGAHLPAADAAICPCGSGLPVEDDGMCIVTACNRPVYRRSHCHIHYLIATGKRDPSLPIPPYVPHAMGTGYDPAFEAELDSRDDDNHCETCSDTGWTTDDGGATYSVCLHEWEDEG